MKSHRAVIIFTCIVVILALSLSVGAFVAIRHVSKRAESRTAENATDNSAVLDSSGYASASGDADISSDTDSGTDSDADAAVDNGQSRNTKGTLESAADDRDISEKNLKATWSYTGNLTAQLILAKWDESSMLPQGAKVEMKSMEDTEIMDAILTYLYLSYTIHKDTEYPPIEKAVQEGESLSFIAEDVGEVFTSITGRKIEGDIRSFPQYDSAKSSYVMPMADGAPYYYTRLLGVDTGADVAKLTCELIQQADVGCVSKGIFILEAIADDGIFGFHIVSMTKVADTYGGDVLAEASSTLPDNSGSLNSFGAGRAVDGDFSTTWTEGADGIGAGESITLSFDTKRTVYGMKLALGYTKSASIYRGNGVPTALRFTFSDGESIEVRFKDAGEVTGEELNQSGKAVGIFGSYHNLPGLGSLETADTVSFGRGYETDTVTITIVDAVPGILYDDTCISEIILY